MPRREGRVSAKPKRWSAGYASQAPNILMAPRLQTLSPGGPRSRPRLEGRGGVVLQIRHDGSADYAFGKSALNKGKSETALDDSANQHYIPPQPVPPKGRFAIVTERGAGCDGRSWRQAGLSLGGRKRGSVR